MKIKRPTDSTGQNPLWPGEGAKKPGTVIRDRKRGEKTIIPIVDSIPHKRNTTT